MTQPVPAQIKKAPPRSLIELKLHNIKQLFNSMDPSPFQEKDLDQDAEDFLVGWAQEYPLHSHLTLRLHLNQAPHEPDAKEHIQEAIRHFFAYKAEMNRLEFSRLMREGRQSLFIGLVFLVSCLALAGFLRDYASGTGFQIIKEGLEIVGWVAMWQPLQIYLYMWWPIRRMGRIYEKMSQMSVEVHLKAPPAKPVPQP